jgi:hypothetical protein
MVGTLEAIFRLVLYESERFWRLTQNHLPSFQPSALLLSEIPRYYVPLLVALSNGPFGLQRAVIAAPNDLLPIGFSPAASAHRL